MSSSHCSFLDSVAGVSLSRPHQGSATQMNSGQALWTSSAHVEGPAVSFKILNRQLPHQHQLSPHGSLSCRTCCSALAFWPKFCCFARSTFLGSEILEFLGTCFSLTDEDLLLLFSYLCFCFPFLEQPFPSPRLRPGSRSAPPDMYLEIVILLKTLFHLAAASLIFIDHADAARRGRFLIPWYTILFIAAQPGEGYDLDLKSQGELRIFFDSRNLIQG